MKYYLINGDDVVYYGKITKDKTSGHVTASLSKYFKKNPFGEWEEEALDNNLHINGRLATLFYRGKVSEYITLELAKKQAGKKR